MKKVQLILGSLILCFGSAQAEVSSKSKTISINPSMMMFDAVAVGQSVTNTAVINNIGEDALQLGTMAISEGQAEHFTVTNDNCSNSLLEVGQSCELSLEFAPISRGQKQALLDIPSNSPDSPLLQAFISNGEDSYQEASRRLSPVLYDLNIPEAMQSGQTYTLEWSVLGYHDDYTSIISIFDCSQVEDGLCGNNYSDASRIYTSNEVTAHEVVSSGWHYDDVYAREFKFRSEFTPDVNQETDIVVRFYRLNSDDKLAGGNGLSLVIPGNLSDRYYDKEGRRISKKILPTSE